MLVTGNIYPAVLGAHSIKFLSAERIREVSEMYVVTVKLHTSYIGKQVRISRLCLLH